MTKSKRFSKFFWLFPSAGVWPSTEDRRKTEQEILEITGTVDALPSTATQQHLLDLYWTYAHPHFCVLYKVSFLRQYRHTLSTPHSTEPSTADGAGNVPTVLLLAIFAVAARYSDLGDEPHWARGQDYYDAAKRILFHDVGSSRLVNVQVMLLLAYRAIGTGAMSEAWLLTGMAIKQAQDLSLHRDADKWFMPTQTLSHETRQARKRVWWACIVLDRYTCSFQGRPPQVHERDYSTAFPDEGEPDEHEQWRPLRPDGTEWGSTPRIKDSSPDAEKSAKPLPAMKAVGVSCFNASGALSVLINRVSPQSLGCSMLSYLADTPRPAGDHQHLCDSHPGSRAVVADSPLAPRPEPGAVVPRPQARAAVLTC